nr:MAG TPA: hypothetical protein [Caudoviricetes sp.]
MICKIPDPVRVRDFLFLRSEISKPFRISDLTGRFGFRRRRIAVKRLRGLKNQVT